MATVAGLNTLTTPAAGDLLHIVDVSASNYDRKITLTSLLSQLPDNLAIQKADGEDLVYAMYSGGTLVGVVWYDDSTGNLVVENNDTGNIVLNVNGGEVHVYDDDAGATVFKIDKSGQAHFKSVSSDPAYIDGYGILYNYVSGSTREMRLRIKDGATEVQFEFPDKDSTSGTEYIVVRDKKTQNTSGGNFTSGAWRTRVINEELVDTGSNCSIASNQITLAAGTYRCRISCPANRVNAHQARLYDITNSAVLLVGTSERAREADYAQTRSFIYGQIVLSGSTVLEVQHRCETTYNTTGFGLAANFTDEIYTVAEFEKVS